MGTLEQSNETLEERIEREFDFEKLSELCEHITDAIREILNSCGLYFRIFSRVKSVDSIAAKLRRGKYGTADNPKKIQDLIGLRVVLYYYDDIRICRDIMESTFQMVDTWSKNNFNSDEFKATKINGVFRYPSEYFNMYKKEMWTLPVDTTFEIQFRTVFFEGWHEIEHDMRYKSILSDDEFWKGSEELSRMLNCILANLELSDWSLVKLFEELAYNHYKRGNWELMLKSHYRIKFEEGATLHPDILKVFDRDKEIAKQFFKSPRITLIREFLRLDSPHITYNMAIQLLNDKFVHNQEIEAICSTLETPKDEHIFHKNTLARLESNVLFQLELPLLHKETRELISEFNNASNILYKWARFKLNPVFDDMPADIISYQNRLPGYQLKIDYDPSTMSFNMKMHYIDSKMVGTLWHIHSSIALMDDGKLHLYHMTSQDTPRRTTQRSTFVKPSFLNDIAGKIGLVDVQKLWNKAQFATNKEEYTILQSLINNPDRKLPLITILQKTDAVTNENSEFRDGYDMNTFSINGTRIAKVTGYYSHIFMLDKSLTKQFAEDNKISESDADGCICIFWPLITKKTFSLYTQQMVNDSQFDFNRFAFHDNNIYEKAFRHKLVQIIKDDNVSH